jgi:hypothetical protein
MPPSGFKRKNPEVTPRSYTLEIRPLHLQLYLHNDCCGRKRLLYIFPLKHTALYTYILPVVTLNKNAFCHRVYLCVCKDFRNKQKISLNRSTGETGSYWIFCRYYLIFRCHVLNLQLAYFNLVININAQ